MFIVCTPKDDCEIGEICDGGICVTGQSTPPGPGTDGPGTLYLHLSYSRIDT